MIPNQLTVRGLKMWFTVGQWKKVMIKLGLMVMRLIALVYCAAEYIFFIACKVRTLRIADYVYPLWFWSFGHQATDLHMMAMRFRGKKLIVLISDYRNFNPYIVDSFGLNICYLRHSWIMIKARSFLKVRELNAVTLPVLRCIFSSKIIEYYHEKNGGIIQGIYMPEYIKLLELHDPVQPLLSVIEQVQSVLPQGWWVSFYFRQKGNDLKNFTPESYRSSIEYVLSLGGRVFCGGDYPNIFQDIPVFHYKNIPCDQHSIDYYFLTQSRFVVCGHSGPLAIATAFNTPVLITNCPRFCVSGYRPNQRIIYKHLMRDGMPVSAYETFSLPVITFTQEKEFTRAGMTMQDNAPEEILAGVKEMLNMKQNDSVDLLEKFRSLLPKESATYQTSCRPTIHYLSLLF